MVPCNSYLRIFTSCNFHLIHMKCDLAMTQYSFLTHLLSWSLINQAVHFPPGNIKYCRLTFYLALFVNRLAPSGRKESDDVVKIYLQCVRTKQQHERPSDVILGAWDTYGPQKLEGLDWTDSSFTSLNGSLSLTFFADFNVCILRKMSELKPEEKFFRIHCFSSIFCLIVCLHEHFSIKAVSVFSLLIDIEEQIEGDR